MATQASFLRSKQMNLVQTSRQMILGFHDDNSRFWEKFSLPPTEPELWLTAGAEVLSGHDHHSV